MMRVRVLLVAAVVMLAAVAQAELVLWLNFEEDEQTKAAGYVIDQSGQANHGMVETGWEGYDLPQYITSHDGSQAMMFGYDNSGVEGNAWNNVAIAKSDSLAHIGNQWTIALWVRVDSTNIGTWHEYPKVISCPNYEIDMHSSSDPASYFWPWDETYGNWDFAMANTQSYEDQWIHMAVTYDGTTFTQYINGVPVFSKDDFSTEFDETTWDQENFEMYPLRVGTHAMGPYNGSQNGYLVGAMDDVAIWGNCYLDADGVMSLYSGTETPLTVEAVPEPATMALLGLGGLLLRKRT